jgi:hypothetical protein
MLRNLSSLVIAIAVACLIVVLGWFALRGGLFQAQNQTTAVSIVDQIKLVAKLQTVEYHGTATVRKNKESTFRPLSRSTVVYLLEGKVVASVDLEQMQIEVLDTGKQRKVRLTLPEVVVDDPVVKRFEILMSCGELLASDLTDEERNSLHQEVLGKLKLAAQEDGIKAKARKQAEDYLRTFLTALGYQAEFA